MSELCDPLTNNELSSNMTRIRVKKGHEDEGLLAFFPDGFVILDEARIPLDDWLAKTSQNGVMFRVQAPFGSGARAIEQNSRAASYLNSGDSFLVVTPGFASAHLWAGVGSNEVEQGAAEKLNNELNRKFSQGASLAKEAEGSESGGFWDSVGGQGEYSRVKESVGFAPDFEPRLFQVSNQSGFMWMEEVPAFGQEDMYNEDCYILDAYGVIYTWIGNKSNKFEQKGVVKRAEKFLAELKDNRNKDEVIIEEVLAGREPPGFTVQFIQWEPEVAAKWLETDPEILAAAAAREAEEEVKAAAEAANANPFDGFLDPATNKFPYETLKSSFP